MAVSLRPRTVEISGAPVVVFETADVERDLDEAIASGGPTPYGRVLWASAAGVAERVASMDLRGRRVLELGCGTGLVSLVAARNGARVLATDVDDGALVAVVHAAEHAGLPVQTAPFDVSGVAPLPAADVVVAADLLYEEPLACAVARRTLEARANGATVVLGDPGRLFRARLVRLLADAAIDARFDAGSVAVIADRDGEHGLRPGI